MDDIHCNVYLGTFKSGSNTANVNIPIVNDNMPECDETFTADIINLGDGFRLGELPSISITITDKGKGNIYIMVIPEFLYNVGAASLAVTHLPFNILSLCNQCM